ncbi:MAG: hypothetical protein OEY29_10025 [Gammaproteobacteria bacterium]|nr:hypothetical protein [Gammaproteobacteria bacterium]
MKKITLILTMLSAVLLSACDKSNDQTTTEAPAQATDITEATKDAVMENTAGSVENTTTPEAEDSAAEAVTTEAVPTEDATASEAVPAEETK